MCPLPKAGELPLDLPDEDRRKRRKRPGRRRARPRPATDQPALFEAPVNQHCGLCRTRVTVLNAAVTCPECGTVVMRSYWDEDQG